MLWGFNTQSIQAQVIATQNETEDFELIRSYYEKGFIEQSLDEIATFRNKYPGTFYDEDLKFFEAVLLLNSGRKSDALNKLVGFVRFYPQSKYLEDALFYTGAAQADLKQAEQSIQTMGRLTSLYPNTDYLPQIKFYRVKAGFYAGDWAYAKKNIDEMTAEPALSQVQQSDLDYIRVWIMVNSSPAAEIREYYQTVVNGKNYSETQKRQLAFHIGQSFYDKEQVDQAIPYLQEALEFEAAGEPSAAQIYFYLGSAWYKDAEAYSLKLAGSMEPKDAQSKENQVAAADRQQNGIANLENSILQNKFRDSLAAHTKNLKENVPFREGYSNYQIALIRFEFKEYQAARTIVKKIINTAKPPADGPDVFRLGFLIERQLKNDKTAHAYISKAISLTDDVADANRFRLERMRLSYKMQECRTIAWDFGELKKSKAPFIKKQTDEITSYAAYCKLLAKEYASAAALYALIPKSSPYYAQNLQLYLDSLKKAGDESAYSTVLAETDTSTLQNQPAFAVDLQLAKIEQAIKEADWNRAQRLIDETRKSGTADQNPKLYFLSATVLAQNGDNTKAEAEYAKAFTLSGSDKPAETLAYAQALAELYKKNGKYRNEANTYKEVLPLITDKKQRGQVLFYIAGLEKRLNNEPAALENYGRLMREGPYPYNVEAALEAADIYLNRNDMKNAEGVLTVILKAKLKGTAYYAPVFFKLASVLHFNENYKKAMFYYRESSSADPKSDTGKEASKRAKELQAYLKTQ